MIIFIMVLVYFIYIIFCSIIKIYYKSRCKLEYTYTITLADGSTIAIRLINKRDRRLKYKFACTVDGQNGSNPYIGFYDGLFLLCPNDVKMAIAMHELGHIVTGAFPKDYKEYYSLRKKGICPNEELIADNFATRVVGKKIMLKKFLFNSLFAPSSLNECVKRTIHIIKTPLPN